MKELLIYHPSELADRLQNETRCLVIDKDGYKCLAYWVEYGGEMKWIEAGAYENSGGIGGDITEDVEYFAAY